MQELPYLGHVITPDGIKPDQNKITAVQSMASPTNISELKKKISWDDELPL